MSMILACACDADGSEDQLCDKESGQCTCRPHVVGLKCKKCEDEYWAFPDCQGRYMITTNHVTLWHFLDILSLNHNIQNLNNQYLSL